MQKATDRPDEGGCDMQAYCLAKHMKKPPIIIGGFAYTELMAFTKL